ncbi:hypothetical protein ABK046_50450, partial [Streptomyces caeruleatus]
HHINQKIDNMKEYLPFEQALEIKELGFNEDAFGYLAIEGTSVQLPLYQQAFRWFREKYKLLGLPKPYGYEIQYNAELHYWG